MKYNHVCFIFNKHLKIEEDFKQTFCLKVKRKSVDCVVINFFCNDVHLENIFFRLKKKHFKNANAQLKVVMYTIHIPYFCISV